MGNHGPRVPAPLPSPIRPRPSCCITVLNRQMTMMNPAPLRRRLPLLMTLLGLWGQPQFVHNPLPKHVIWSFWFLFCAAHFYLFRGYMWSWEEPSLWNWAGVYCLGVFIYIPGIVTQSLAPPPHKGTVVEKERLLFILHWSLVLHIRVFIKTVFLTLYGYCSSS